MQNEKVFIKLRKSSNLPTTTVNLIIGRVLLWLFEIIRLNIIGTKSNNLTTVKNVESLSFILCFYGLVILLSKMYLVPSLYKRVSMDVFTCTCMQKSTVF